MVTTSSGAASSWNPEYQMLTLNVTGYSVIHVNVSRERKEVIGGTNRKG